jgi:nitroreductase
MVNFDNEVINTIKTRRSVREYIDKEVEEDKIKIILECAIYAPSARNSQPWFFTVIKNKDLLKLSL